MTINFYIRGGTLQILGSSTPPTAGQASQVQTQKALINFLDADTQALFTHNWGLDASAPTYRDPEVHAHCETQGPLTATFLPLLTFDVTNTNVVKVNKPALGGTAGTFIVTIRRPHSIGQ